MGNGLNNLYTTYSWKRLIDDLVDFIGATGQIRTAGKPFPLLYEEIVTKAIQEDRTTEAEIKVYIAKKLGTMKSGPIHNELVRLSQQHIITTNYDQTLEKCIEPLAPLCQNEGVVKESLYSLFRRNIVKEYTIWHIHGDISLPNTICLGYEQYGGYLQQMRAYVATGTGSTYKKCRYEPIVKRLRAQQGQNDSWIDLLFTSDVHIVGLTLEFIEVHLWWLLSYRARAKNRHGGLISNKIRYYYPAIKGQTIENRLDLLKACDVNSYSCILKKDNWSNYYESVLSKIANA